MQIQKSAWAYLYLTLFLAAIIPAVLFWAIAGDPELPWAGWVVSTVWALTVMVIGFFIHFHIEEVVGYWERVARIRLENLIDLDTRIRNQGNIIDQLNALLRESHDAREMGILLRSDLEDKITRAVGLLQVALNGDLAHAGKGVHAALEHLRGDSSPSMTDLMVTPESIGDLPDTTPEVLEK